MRFPLRRDSVPAMLAPGEMVLNNRQQHALATGHPERLLPEQVARLRMMARSKPQHFAFGGVAEGRFRFGRGFGRGMGGGMAAERGGGGRGDGLDVYDDWGHRIDGATPSWYTSPKGQGPLGNEPWSEPTPIPGNMNRSDRMNPHDWQTDYGRNTYAMTNWNPGYVGYISPWGGPGALQGPTMIPTGFNQQGYPYAVPANPFVWTNNSDPLGLMHAGQQLKGE